MKARVGLDRGMLQRLTSGGKKYRIATYIAAYATISMGAAISMNLTILHPRIGMTE
jgi:hypothetical protein